MKTAGLIGGTSWFTTVDYYRLINEIISERTGTNPPLLLYSLSIDVMRSGDWDVINAAYLKTGKLLEQAGAQALVICANTPHKVCDYVEPQLGIPFLHIADATAEEAKRMGLSKLGLLATLPVVQGDFISSRIHEKYGIEVVLPERRDRVNMHKLIANELTRGQFTPEGRTFTLQAMDHLKRQGVDGIILGCTELPQLVSQDDFDLPLLDTTMLHARMAVDFILGED